MVGPHLVGGLEHVFFFHSVGNVIIPTDFRILFKGVGIPPTPTSHICLRLWWSACSLACSQLPTGKGHCNGRSLFVGRVMSSHVEPLVEKTKAKTAANVDMAFLTAAQNLVEMRTGGWQRRRNGWQFCGKATEGCFLVGGLEHFVFFHNIWDNPSHRLIFFKMVKTTNQFLFVILRWMAVEGFYVWFIAVNVKCMCFPLSSREKCDNSGNRLVSHEILRLAMEKHPNMTYSKKP